MLIRLSTYNTPLFNEGGFGLNEGWREFDTDEMTPEQKDLLEAYSGRIIQVAPDQLEDLARELGLELHEGTFRYAGGADANKGKSELGTRHRIEAGEMQAPAPEPAPKKAGAQGRPVAAPATATATAPTLTSTTDADARAVQPQPTTAVPTNVVDPAHTPAKKSHR